MVGEKTKKIRILYVGASVTAQKSGYRSSLNCLFENAGFSVIENVMATGATGSLFGLCNLRSLSECWFDISIYEYSTGDLNIGLTPKGMMVECVQKSLEILKYKSAKVLVVNNYRSDFENGKGDFVRDGYREAAMRVGVPTLDLYKKFEVLRRKYGETWDEYYRDKVHTNDQGSAIIAKEIFDFLNRFEWPADSVKPVPDLAMLPALYPIPSSCREQLTYIYPASKQKFSYFSLKEGQEICFEMKGRLLGFVAIVGPTSGWINISVGGSQILEYCMFDTHCHYTRVQPRIVSHSFDEYSKVSISLPNRKVDTSICSVSHASHFGERELGLSSMIGIGLSIRNFEFKDR